MRASDLNIITGAPLKNGTRVLLRLDLNVPCRGGKVYNDYRIQRALPTLRLLEKKGCRTVIISHIEGEEGNTLLPVFEYLKGLLRVTFAPTFSSAEQDSVKLSAGDFLLVENIRREEGETDNDRALAKRLASLGDIYINDAFAVSHRRHASVIAITEYLDAYAGLLLWDEVNELSSAIEPTAPSLFILGGAKFETKLPLLVKFLSRYSKVFVGGALANDVFAAKGLSLGTSLLSDTKPDFAGVLDHKNLVLPSDFVVSHGDKAIEQDAVSLSSGGRVVDAGPRTSAVLARLVQESKFILWNGPLGEYQKGFVERTEELAKMIAQANVRSLIGGGDTIACVDKLNLLDKFSFVSTGGGAMLEFLSRETLPGLEVLRK